MYVHITNGTLSYYLFEIGKCEKCRDFDNVHLQEVGSTVKHDTCVNFAGTVLHVRQKSIKIQTELNSSGYFLHLSFELTWIKIS